VTVEPASAVAGAAATALATRFAAGAGVTVSAPGAVAVLFAVRPPSNTEPSRSLRTRTRHAPLTSTGTVKVERTV
jgi:hypothetical protein